MIIVLAIDALEYDKVEEFGCTSLKQESFGKTDIAEFSEPRTMVLWSSFMTGSNKEKEVLALGDKMMWSYRISQPETLFAAFKSPSVIDLPGYDYDLAVHEKSRKLLKAFFDESDKAKKEAIKAEYNKDAFGHHRLVKERFFNALGEKHDFVLGYFSLADVVGHLNFGNAVMMKMIYKEFDEIAREARKRGDKVLILSDHGMHQIGIFGDHSNHGFWSLNFKATLKKPKITEFKGIILGMKK